MQYDLKKIEESLIYYTKAIELNPADGISYLHQAIAFNILKRHEEALQSYNKLISLDDKYEEAWIGRAITFALLNRCKDDLSDIDHLLTLNPKIVTDYYQKQIYCLNLKDTKKH
ncbi:hypothetical protein [Candidatus Tisiphia endosymbiont of Dascillus cervinus]|uniref:tetratricopeptide repeat protein n=1 Tax=Candidatus Tisiphia endosymbiont of Dascillus cervinus TaxID=3066253 RepID=UPI00312CA888